MLKETTPQLTAPVVVFSYYNPLLRRGIDTFCKQVKDAGASGMGVDAWFMAACACLCVELPNGQHTLNTHENATQYHYT